MSDLFERTWPRADAKAAVVIVHGLAEHSGRYEHVAHALNASGYAAYARDVRGHGRSVGFPADMGGDAQLLVDDVVELCVRVRGEHDRTFLLGHSMGTLISLTAAAAAPEGTIAGLVLSGLAMQPGPVILEALGGPPGGSIAPEAISRDPGIVKAYVDDPLVFKKIPADVVPILLDLGVKSADAIDRMTLPVLLLHGTADRICEVDGSRAAYAQMTVTDRTLKEYPGLYHEVLNEPERDQVIGDLIGWLDAHVAG